MTWSKLSDTEIALAKKWYVEEDLSAAKIAQGRGGRVGLGDGVRDASFHGV